MRPPPQQPRPASAGTLIAPVAIGLFLFSPIVLLAWLVGQAVLRATGWRWWWLGLPSAAALGLLVWAYGGPLPALAAHFAWFLQTGPALLSGQHPPVLIGAALVPEIPLAVPVGLLTASLNLAMRPAHALDPYTTQRQQRAGARRERQAAKLAANAGGGTSGKLPGPPLAVSVGGDLDGWRHGRFIIPPRWVLGLPRAYIGQPGFGKSVGLEREVYLAAHAGRHVGVFDGKGSEASFAPGIVAAYLAGWAAAGRDPESVRVGLYPAQPMDVWRGGPRAVANRFMACWSFPGISEFYGEAAQLALRLALEAPGGEVTSSRDLARRIQPGTLRRLWEQHPDELELVKSIEQQLPGVSIRLGNLLAALGATLDGGWSHEDVDLAVVTVPTTAAPKDADAILRVLLVDYAHYTLARKPRGEQDTLIFDEFSAMEGGRRAAINLVERARGSGSGVILAAQSRRALGDDDEASRILHACSGGVTLFRSAEPEDVARLAGTLRVPDLVYQLEDGQPTGRAAATLRAQHRLDPNQVRAYVPGEAAIIEGGRVERVRIIRTAAPEHLLLRARELVDDASSALPIPAHPKELPS